MADVEKLMRLLRPIYDAIDGRQYKNAIKLCNQKKICDIDLVQVLQAHCLERTGKVDDALRIVRRVQLKKPTDENLLHTMQLVFKLCGVPDEMLSTYEHAAVAHPTNKDMHCQLFFGYTRSLSLAKQQQLAFKMYKTFHSLQYVGWACLSMLLQVTVEKSLPVKMLHLADKMLIKALRDHPADSNGELGLLLVQLLQAQDKPHEAMAAFHEFIRQESECGGDAAKPRALEGQGVPDDEIELGPMQAIDRKVLEASLAADIQDWHTAAAAYTDLLTTFHAADDWAFWVGLIDATFHVGTAAAHAHLRHTIDTLQQQHGDKLRGPWLAGVEVAVRHATGSSSSDNNDQDQRDAAVVVAAIVPYMDRFASKACCVTDLQRYAGVLGDAGKAAWVTACQARLSTACHQQGAAVGDDDQLKWFRQALTARKMLRFLGEHATLSVEALLGRVDAMLDEYHANQPLNHQAVGGQREVQVTDDLLLLTVLLLVDVVDVADTVSQTKSRRDWLLHAATCLEFGLAKSAYNFQMKLLLCRIYALLGAGTAFFARYQELDVKQIQVDSLSYLVLDPLLALGQVDDARRICDAVRALHRTTARDTPEFISRAYKLGVFSKAQDMTMFLLHKMKRSQMLAVATSELVHSALVDLSRTSTSHLHTQLTLQPTLPLLPDLDRLVQDATADPALLAQWLQLRACVPHILSGVAAGATSEVLEGHIDTFKSVVQSLQHIHAAATPLWTVSQTAADALLLAISGDFAGASATLDTLATQLMHVTVFDSLVESDIGDDIGDDKAQLLSTWGLSLASLWAFQLSPYVLLFVAMVAKVVKPKKKAKAADDKKGCIDSLKAVVQAHVALNVRGQHVCKQFKAVVPRVRAHPVVAEAAGGVQAKVAAAQDASAANLLAVLTDHVGFLRSI
ncbi:hypothetical protein DYB36_007333 [Aphanomyces astaci]|uniref:N-terminal acetyltransferase B complex subunit NAA25 homolog n=1 Tax=Aphanomyces astaci TaxID=112090 RepID=A0A396ZSQ9_APHAT|nr:hypothetical protein DYB36_007333 [Aphanomyces astaci]